MNLTYTGRHMEIADEMKEYVEKRMKKIKFYFDHIINISVIFEVQRNQYSIEIKISSNHDVFFAKETDSNWNTAVDSVTDKIEKEVKKKMDKITDHR